MKKAILILLICAGYSNAKGQPQPDPDTTAKHFLIVASIGNLHEVSAAQLALKKSKSIDVRAFAEMMVKDHGEAEQKLMKLAGIHHIPLPSAAITGIQADLNLKNAGDNFDKLYVHAMLSGHRTTVGMFQTYAINGKNPAVRAFAQQMLPKLRAHLAAIIALDKQMNSN